MHALTLEVKGMSTSVAFMNIQHVCSAVVVFVISTLSARGLVKMDSQWLFKEAFCMNALQIHASILQPSVKFSD